MTVKTYHCSTTLSCILPPNQIVDKLYQIGFVVSAKEDFELSLISKDNFKMKQQDLANFIYISDSSSEMSTP